jgi:hypothetical protein
VRWVTGVGQRGGEGSTEMASPWWRHLVGGDLSTVARYGDRGGRLQVRGGSRGDGGAWGDSDLTRGWLERVVRMRPSRWR